MLAIVLISSVLSVFLIGVIVVIYRMDRSRILQAAEDNLWTDIKISWAPLAPGAIFDTNERGYLVRYKDQNGLNSFCFCKTSMFTGVNWYNG